MKILVINGPNLNFLGIREKGIYGTTDYAGLVKMIEDKGKETGNEIEVFQSNHEGAIIDKIQEAYFDGTQGIVINPGAFTHYSYAIRDALASIEVPKVEIPDLAGAEYSLYVIDVFNTDGIIGNTELTMPIDLGVVPKFWVQLSFL